jgi:DNA-directed RNA polymerase subunit M/transcription elongation factor TFIIS
MANFCEACGNMYIYQIDKNGVLSYFCRMCGNTQKIQSSGQCLVINELNGNAHDYPINLNMIYDNTLPRTKKIVCQNQQCPSKNTDKNPEMVIFQYNPDMLNVGYLCTVCRNYFKN